MQTPSPLDSVLFDLDGTLWDLTPTVAKARNNVLRAKGLLTTEMTAADVAKTVGLPVDEVYRRSFPDFAPALVEEVKREVNLEIGRLLPVEGARLYEGVREGLAALKQDFRLFIVSNCNGGYIENFLAWSGFGPLIEDFECYGRTKKSKAENIADVVRRNRLASPVYVGDTASDHEAALGAGVHYLHVAYGFGKPVGPCPVFASFPELVNALKP